MPDTKAPSSRLGNRLPMTQKSTIMAVAQEGFADGQAPPALVKTFVSRFKGLEIMEKRSKRHGSILAKAGNSVVLSAGTGGKRGFPPRRMPLPPRN
jgi:hypothetical protein